MALSPKAKSYFRAQAKLVEEHSFWNCPATVETMAALLLEERRSPWIGRLRKSEARGDAVFHAPLMPVRFNSAITWNTHYVCVERGTVYDLPRRGHFHSAVTAKWYSARRFRLNNSSPRVMLRDT